MDISEGIIKTKRLILDKLAEEGFPADRAVFSAFWDFDGTIIRGDCTEGLIENGRQVYAGLAETAIRAGFSTEFPREGYPSYEKKYREIMAENGKAAAYSFVPSAFAGAGRDELLGLSEKYFESDLKKYFFSASVRIIRRLLENGIAVRVISASPEFFVAASDATLGLDRSFINGMRPVTVNGRIAPGVEKPVPYAGGKTDIIKKIDVSVRATGVRHFILAGFGNSYESDGPFLSWIVSQKLPAGTPAAVMINGGEPPPGYRGGFIRLELAE
ncbi:MAG: haloacid dehalogenase-like hydrolase [Spirochaetes bacterium]|nr:haloacid dehalogenase-like hydrolase [Spirochaetota bacterium]